LLKSLLYFEICSFGKHREDSSAILKDLKRKLAEIAAKELQADPEDLEFRDRRIFTKGNPEKGIDFWNAIGSRTS
jgi:hypothetical protein